MIVFPSHWPGLDIGTRPLAQVSVKSCLASTNHRSLAQFGKYYFHIQNIFKISVTFYFPLLTHDSSTKPLNVARWLFLTAFTVQFQHFACKLQEFREYYMYYNLGILYVSAFQLLKSVCSFFLLWS